MQETMFAPRTLPGPAPAPAVDRGPFGTPVHDMPVHDTPIYDAMVRQWRQEGRTLPRPSAPAAWERVAEADRFHRP
ncbi:hypothetical protein AMK16_20815 [Streptomyces sp. CB00455]|uniref:hypothetical protein n=1 Tax=Streptomyces sp. CB00455 TaxID=1703927 RepID=UPI0009401A21|nr:hypothetical protein [Streptomyces sp. CB00455]OKK17306.1 hypothetical protein AMK16_20815 [Streptomyces sp. CB00455]